MSPQIASGTWALRRKSDMALFIVFYVLGMFMAGVITASDDPYEFRMRRVFFNAFFWPYVAVRFTIKNW